MKVAIVKLTSQAWNEHCMRIKRKAQTHGKVYTELPKKVYFGGAAYSFDPSCEVPEYVGKEMSKRGYIELVEIKEVFDVPRFTVLDTDEKQEHDYRYGEVHLCKHCGWPYATPQGRDMHEKRFCSRRGE